MGADGHIRIWRTEVVKAKWPDADSLFSEVATHYRDKLDGIEYDHMYWGDNLYMDPFDVEECYEKDPVKKARLKEFLEWLQNNGTHWEVWT